MHASAFLSSPNQLSFKPQINRLQLSSQGLYGTLVLGLFVEYKLSLVSILSSPYPSKGSSCETSSEKNETHTFSDGANKKDALILQEQTLHTLEEKEKRIRRVMYYNEF